MKKPVVSIVMATYNRASFIVESLQSIRNQSFTDWECLIVDDGGTDHTPEVLKPLQEEDDRIKYVKRTDQYKKGLPGSRNCGIDMASGDFIIFFDDDDIVHPNNLEYCLDQFKKHTIDFCRYERAVFINNFDYDFEQPEALVEKPISSIHLYEIISNQLPFNSCQVMWKRAFIGKNRFNEDLMYAEEWEFYSRLVASDAKGISINKVLFYGRKHEQSNTGEFYNNDPVRRASKEYAISEIFKNLLEKNYLSKNIENYLISLVIISRNKKLFNKLISRCKPAIIPLFKYQLRYLTYPLWKKRKNLKKKWR